MKIKVVRVRTSNDKCYYIYDDSEKFVLYESPIDASRITGSDEDLSVYYTSVRNKIKNVLKRMYKNYDSIYFYVESVEFELSEVEGSAKRLVNKDFNEKCKKENFDNLNKDYKFKRKSRYSVLVDSRTGGRLYAYRYSEDSKDLVLSYTPMYYKTKNEAIEVLEEVKRRFENNIILEFIYLPDSIRIVTEEILL